MPLKYRQYTIRLDGSGCLARRNHAHLKPIHDATPVTPLVQPVPPVPWTSPINSTTTENHVRCSARPSNKPDFYCGQIVK